MTILEDVLERLHQAAPKAPIFPHKDHPQVMLAVVQQIVIKYQFIDPTEAQQILAALRQEGQEYIAQHESDVSPADYEVVWPDIEIILSQAAKPGGG